MPREACHIKAGSKSHATSDTMVSPILWYHALEMESMRKTVEQHSQDLTLVKSTFCGLQRLITVKVDSLVQRVEALEGAMAPGRKQGDQEAATHATQVHHEVLVERLDTVDVSMTDLETRFELLRSDTTAQLATFSVGLSINRRSSVARNSCQWRMTCRHALQKLPVILHAWRGSMRSGQRRKQCKAAAQSNFGSWLRKLFGSACKTCCHLRSLEPCHSRLNHPPGPQACGIVVPP